MGNKSRNYPTYIVEDQLKEIEARETVAHGSRNSGMYAMINVDLMRISKKTHN